MRDATWQILMGHWWLEAGLVWAVELFFRPQGASWSIRLQPVLFRCGCTQHALGVPWADSKLVFDHIVIARHCVHPFGLCNVNILHKKKTQQHPSAGFIPTAWKEAKMATAASTWGLLADVSCKPRHSGHSEHSAFHYDVLVAFVDRSPGGKYSLNLTLSVGSATRVQTLREGVYWKGGVKNWIEIVVFFCM